MFFKTKHPRKQYMYAVVTGDYCGEMLAFVESTSNTYNFISVPKNENRAVPADKFNLGIKNGLVETVEKLPGYVYSVLVKQYQYNKMHK